MPTKYKEHWNAIYADKQPDEVSWTQEVPCVSLEFIRSFDLPKSAKIIDIGGGDSKLVDFLLQEGYENITVLDISVKAIARAKRRLGNLSEKVNWIISDITEFTPTTDYDVWHDRAAFHFLTTPAQISAYLNTAKNHVRGYLVIGTFSENGPTKCSGLEIKQYSEQTLAANFQDSFESLKCLVQDHTTPFGTKQNFIFCSFKKR